MGNSTVRHTQWSLEKPPQDVLSLTLELTHDTNQINILRAAPARLSGTFLAYPCHPFGH